MTSPYAVSGVGVSLRFAGAMNSVILLIYVFSFLSVVNLD